MKNLLTFENIIFHLQKFWQAKGCILVQPTDLEVGAGTFHPATLLKSLGKKEWNCAYIQQCRRPTDGRYGENPNRMQQYFQFQVLLKPSPNDIQKLYLKSLESLRINLKDNDIRFVEDDWESPTLGASGLGWEVWCDGMEITQFTYFQQMAGYECKPVSVEITYGLERICMFIQSKDSVYDLDWNDQGTKYKDIYLRSEKEYSAYNFEHANTDTLLQTFIGVENECNNLYEKKLCFPAYDQCLKASHIFNLLDSRGIISVTERANYINRIRSLTKKCGELWLEQPK